MKNHSKTILFLGLFVLSLTACKQDEESELLSGTVTFTLNGDGFTNQTFTENVTSAEAPVAESGVYGDATLLAVGTYTQGDENRNYWSGYVEGKTTGTYAWDNSLNARVNSCQVLVWDNNQEVSYLHYVFGEAASGTTVITEFGNVGGRIEGTFSGTLYNSDTDAPVAITNGKFSVVRKEDVP